MKYWGVLFMFTAILSLLKVEGQQDWPPKPYIRNQYSAPGQPPPDSRGRAPQPPPAAPYQGPAGTGQTQNRQGQSPGGYGGGPAGQGRPPGGRNAQVEAVGQFLRTEEGQKDLAAAVDKEAGVIAQEMIEVLQEDAARAEAIGDTNSVSLSSVPLERVIFILTLVLPLVVEV